MRILSPSRNDLFQDFDSNIEHTDFNVLCGNYGGWFSWAQGLASAQPNNDNYNG
jgi:hypothetical protein